MFVIAYQHAGRQAGRLQQIVTEERRFVIEIQQTKQGWSQVDLTRKLAVFTRRTELGRVDEQRDLVVANRQIFLARAASGVISDKDEDGFVEPCFLSGCEDRITCQPAAW